MMNNGSYFLHQIDVYNWGGFYGLHTAHIDKEGTAIIGQTGSGKTTLIDALMTLLVAKPYYNLASTGGHESDRDLMSYIRGIANPDDKDDTNRTGKTITAIRAYFYPIKTDLSTQIYQQELFGDNTFVSQNQPKNTVQLTAIFWIDSNSNHAKDRNDLWIFSHDDFSLKDYIQEFHQSGKRGFKAWIKNHDNIHVFDSKSSYLSKVQNFFDVSDNAFKLLNRTVGLKQLNSIDEIFRELVLDDESLFEKANDIITQFDDLSQIRQDVQTAKKQQQSLLPLRNLQKQWQENDNQITHINALIDYLPIWYNYHAHGIYDNIQKELKIDNEQLKITLNHAEQEKENTKQQKELLQSQYYQKGGNDITHLKRQIEQTKKDLDKTSKYHKQYLSLIRYFGLTYQDSQQDFLKNKEQLANIQEQIRQNIDNTTQELHEIGAKRHSHQNDITNINAQLNEAKKQTSNIPLEFIKFKESLAEHLNIACDELYYLAELIEVQDKAWQGAIERAIGSHRLRLFVPEHLTQSALAWVNHRQNRLHVRLFSATNTPTHKEIFHDSFIYKLTIKDNHLSLSVFHVLTDIDRHCVNDTNALQHTPHAMTKEGLMSNKKHYFDKQDQKSLKDDWLTGFDNKNLVHQLSTKLKQSTDEYKIADQQYQNLSDAIKELNDKERSIILLKDMAFDDIDVISLSNTLNNLNRHYQELTKPDSDLAKLIRQIDDLDHEINNQENLITDITVELKENEKDIKKYTQEIDKLAISLITSI